MKIPELTFRSKVSSTIPLKTVDLDFLYTNRASLPIAPETPHRLDFNVLIYIEEGEGEHFIDFVRIPFKGNSFIFVRKNQVHAFDFGRKVKGKLILFSNEFITHVQESLNVPFFASLHLISHASPVFFASPTLKKSSDHLLQAIEKEAQQDDKDYPIIMLLFASLFLMIERERKTSQQALLGNTTYAKFSQFIALLEAQFAQQKSASYYAKELNITYKTLNQCCKLVSGNTAKQLINAYIILEAKRRLVIEGCSIQKLADELGFDETSNFIKFFKKQTSLTPAQFKKQS